MTIVIITAITTACPQVVEADSLEGLIDGSVPAEEGTGRKEDEPEDGETKVETFSGVPDEEGEAGQNVEEQSHTVHWKSIEQSQLATT